jgi:hypothetical protein
MSKYFCPGIFYIFFISPGSRRENMLRAIEYYVCKMGKGMCRAIYAGRQMIG